MQGYGVYQCEQNCPKNSLRVLAIEKLSRNSDWPMTKNTELVIRESHYVHKNGGDQVLINIRSELIMIKRPV